MRVALSFFGVACFALGGYSSSSAQDAIGLIPLESTCEDVKRILKVQECTFPQSVLFLSDFWVTLNFVSNRPAEPDKNQFCYNVPNGRVQSYTIAYNKPFPLKDFPYELTYVKGPFGDIRTVAYENRERGIKVLSNNGKINTVSIVPTPRQRQKFAYSCSEKRGVKPKTRGR